MLNISKIIEESFENVDLLLCGGASGHMSHLFEDPDLTFKQLKDIKNRKIFIFIEVHR